MPTCWRCDPCSTRMGTYNNLWILSQSLCTNKTNRCIAYQRVICILKTFILWQAVKQLVWLPPHRKKKNAEALATTASQSQLVIDWTHRIQNAGRKIKEMLSSVAVTAVAVAAINVTAFTITLAAPGVAITAVTV
jgi:hypothetical protein